MSNANGDSHRTRLLQAARELLLEREYGNISARDLVSASNTNLGSIGYHFGSKEALLNEAIGLAFEDWAQAIGGAIRGKKNAGLAELMSGSLRVALDEFDAMRPYFQAFIEALARSSRSPQLREQLASHYRRQRDRVAGWITEAIGATLAPDEARYLASIMLATADGLMIQAFVDPEDVPGSRQLARAGAKAFAGIGAASRVGAI
jgi:AcrR family transcriptional regulator